MAMTSQNAWNIEEDKHAINVQYIRILKNSKA